VAATDRALAPQRVATQADAPHIAALMRRSVLELFPRCYDERQTASAAEHIAHIDMRLVEDGTYFVHEAGGEVVACGGWSRRAKLYTGDGDEDDRLLDPAREPARVRAMFVRGDWTRRGLGRAFGFREVERFTLTMRDGVSVEAVAMERPIDPGP
jgi:hypothetical protein